MSSLTLFTIGFGMLLPNLPKAYAAGSQDNAPVEPLTLNYKITPVVTPMIVVGESRANEEARIATEQAAKEAAKQQAEAEEAKKAAQAEADKQAAAAAEQAQIATQAPQTELVSYPQGWCTYYAASRFPVTWWGDAREWPSNAADQGYRVDSKPEPGALLITAESSRGHVQVIDSTPNDGIHVTEENYKGFGIVSTRVIPYNYPLIRAVIHRK